MGTLTSHRITATDACATAQHCSLLTVAIETAKPYETGNPYVDQLYILFR